MEIVDYSINGYWLLFKPICFTSSMITTKKLQKLIKVDIRASNVNTRSMFHNKVESDATNKYIQSTHVFKHIDRHPNHRHIQTNSNIHIQTNRFRHIS